RMQRVTDVNLRTRCYSVPTTQVNEQGGSSHSNNVFLLASKMVHARGACYHGRTLGETQYQGMVIATHMCRTRWNAWGEPCTSTKPLRPSSCTTRRAGPTACQ